MGNGIFYLLHYQYKTVKKIANHEGISLYEVGSILTLHAGLYTVGSLYSPISAYANARMLYLPKDTIYLHSDTWLSPKIKKRFAENKLGYMAWNGDKDYAIWSKEKDAAILLNWCTLKTREIKGKQCYVAECRYSWQGIVSKTQFRMGFMTITVHEQLFYELEKRNILHPYTLVCYYEKDR